MSTQDIRLRLTIWRHGVPQIKLIWPCACSSDTTIAKLLTQVNEVVPLESSEWGLEDYAVELSDDQGGSYECLHFQLVSQILKDEDHVVIRSLLTDDIRRRRLSGRHQISTDGKHLVDGLAFGRPWLRTPRDRPSFELPPRKKARIEYQDLAEQDPEPEKLFLEGPPSLDEAPDGHLPSNLTDGGGDTDDDDDSEDQDDEFDPGQETEQSASVDSEGDVDVDSSPGALAEELRFLNEDGDSGNNQSTSNEATLEQLGVLRMAFPLLSFSTIEKELFRQKQNLRRTYNTLRRSTAPSLSFDDMMDRMVTGLLGQHESSPVQPALPSLFHQSQPASRPLIEEVESSDTSTSGSNCESTSDFDDDDDDDNDHSESNSSDSKDSSDASDESSNGDSDESSDNSSDSDSDEDCGGSSVDESSDESSDDSSSDSDGFRPAPQPESKKPVQEIAGPIQALIKREGTAPHEGLSRTRKRNARRKRAKLLGQQEGTSTPESDNAELLARKEALLGALSEDTKPPEPASEPILTAGGKATQTMEKPRSETLPASSHDSSGRRARVDMGAGRRMVFGALGLKHPKSKADEERIREGLMKDVKALNNARIVQVVDGKEDIKEPKSSEDDADADAWKSRITYRAVECCHEGMVLSEPPFPFVQRWDPQQHYGSMRKRKRESQAYYDDSYVEEGSDVFGGEAEAIDAKSNATERQSTIGRDPFGHDVNGVKQVGGESEDAAATNGDGADDGDDVNVEKDVPALPEDMSSLATLEKGGAKEGMVITWKQCIMSKATRWQPVIASVTGEVLPGSSESSLEVRLALRDREHREKVYDEQGQRVYDKFEVPDFEEDQEAADDGHRTIGWHEMMEPKILRDAHAVADG